MASERQPRTRVDADGVRTTKKPGVRGEIWLAVLVLVGIGAVLFFARPQPASEMPAPSNMTAPIPQKNVAEAKRAERVNRLSAESRELPPPADLEAADLPDDMDSNPSLEELEKEAPTGIGLFPPPGTDPLKRGIVVPEDFELPPGFMRHYQVTDDGKPLRAILMFHPDYRPVDEDGEPIPLPEDRVVPPEMAPPGLAIEVLDDPEPAIPSVEERDAANQ